MKRFLDVYWVIYFIGYLVTVAILLWLHWNDLISGNNTTGRLADIYTIAAGSASAFAIVVEVGGRMVLLIPKAVKKLRDEVRKELNAEWESWLKRREKAEAANEPFDEPPPSRRE